jgi:pyruvate kinase
VHSGIRSFRINGAYYQYNKYKKVIEDLHTVMKQVNDAATVIFDLKGPIPRISKIGSNKETLDVKKNQLVKLVYENKKINDNDVIHVDRKILDLIKVGDRIVIDSSNTILKVIGVDRYKRKHSGSIHSLRGLENNTINTYESFMDQDMLDDIQLNINKLHTIEEKDEEEESFLHVDHNLDSNMEDRMKQRQMKIRQAYQSVINKHKGYNEHLKINELRCLTCSDTSSSKYCS